MNQELDFSESGTLVDIRFNAKLQPVHRAEIFEEPLFDMLEKSGLGSVDGGGTAMDPDTGEVQFCHTGFFAADASDEFIAQVIELMHELGAPKGSTVTVQFDDGDVDHPIGVTEGLALYLNGTDLPDDVYAAHDTDDLVDQLEDALDDAGVMMSHWQGPTETGLYFYGDSYAEMVAAITPVVDAHPLAQRSRMAQIA
jgi:hypothetical protein